MLGMSTWETRLETCLCLTCLWMKVQVTFRSLLRGLYSLRIKSRESDTPKRTKWPKRRTRRVWRRITRWSSSPNSCSLSFSVKPQPIFMMWAVARATCHSNLQRELKMDLGWLSLTVVLGMWRHAGWKSRRGEYRRGRSLWWILNGSLPRIIMRLLRVRMKKRWP